VNEIENINPDWLKFLENEFNQDYFSNIQKVVNHAYTQEQIYPPKDLIFNAFNLCALNDLKVVIIGQDPYHGPHQANGLSFSVQQGVAIPPSLKNIFKELAQDIPSFKIPENGDLGAWAKQGVLLLNAVLTVKANQPGSHKAIGWEQFTNALIKLLSDQKQHLVFMLWGNYAIKKAELIDSNKHLILRAAHPSPLARGAFFGNKHFSKTNAYLIQSNQKPIDWNLKNMDLFDH